MSERSRSEIRRGESPRGEPRRGESRRSRPGGRGGRPPRGLPWRPIALGVIGLFVIVLVAGLVRNAVRPAPVEAARAVAPIDPEVYRPYTRDSAPVLYALWGEAMMATINDLKKGAAEVVARDPRCDAPAYTDLHGSSNPRKIVILVTCKNQWSTTIEDWKIRAGLRDAAAGAAPAP